MGNFYDSWLAMWDVEQEERRKARKCIHEDELEWVRTKQDYKAALVCARENGFFTSGALMLAEIPLGWNTGKHAHGEEAMYIIEGTGCSIIDGKRYDWETGSCIFVSFGSMHQHFNLGKKRAVYLSAMELALERFAGLAKFSQYEEASETHMHALEGIPEAESDIDPEYGRIILRAEDTPVVSSKEAAAKRGQGTDEFARTMAKEMRTAGTPGHRHKMTCLMGWAGNDFRARQAEITTVEHDLPGTHSGKHAHMEALLYVLQGEGYSIVDDEKIPWQKGTLIHIPGPQTVHQHFCTGDTEARALRIHYGLRAHYFQAIAKRTFPYLYYEFSSYK